MRASAESVTVAWRALSSVAVFTLLGALLLAVSADPAHAATTFTVNSTDDSPDQNTANGVCDTGILLFPSGEPQCTLRAAIEQTNATTGEDVIAFNIPGSGLKTIAPTSPLPEIIAPAMIDGYSQPGTKKNTKAVGNDAVLGIELSGTNAGSLADGLAFSETADGSAVSGLVINRFSRHGMDLGTADLNTVYGNFIGTDATGTVALGNGYGGTGDAGVYLAGIQNEVGDGTPATRNVISGNWEGVSVALWAFKITTYPLQNNYIRGNYIGTDGSGTAKLGNFYAGVTIRNALHTRLDRNVISGNDGDGIAAHAADNPHNTGTTYMWRNHIGTKSDGVGPLGNAGNGVLLTSDANFVNDAPDTTNTIAFNGGDGVRVSGGVENRIQYNSIYANGGLGINLGEDGVTPNDPGDADTGSNALQNFPVITSATTSRKSTLMKGKLNSSPGTTFTVQLFSNPKGTNEGKTFLGQTNVTTDSGSDASFSFKTKKKAGGALTATATNDATGGTSEFSAPKKVVRRR